MRQRILTTLKLSSVLISAAFLSQSALASGYHFGTQSVSSQGTANSSAAEAADPSTLFYNPAGLTKLEGTQISANVNLVAPSVKYSEAWGKYPSGANISASPDMKGQAQTSGKISDSLVVAPHLFASHKLNDQVALGVGMYVPFGSGTEYDENSVLRYNLNELGLKSIAIQPTVAYKFNDHHSVALGLVAQNTSARLRQYANFGPFAGRDGVADGYAKVKGDDWGFGYNLAWLWDINDSARVGVNYRSKIKHNLEGTANWELVGPAFANPALKAGVRGAGYVAEEDASVKITTPESLSVHGMYKIDPKWNVFGDVTWTRHSRFNQAELVYANKKRVAGVGGAPTTSDKTILTPNWRDTYKVAVGASYQITDPLQLRFGMAYDQSPVKSAEYRMSTLPDNNRIWFSFGGKYDINKNHSINAAYSYLHIQSAEAKVNGYCGGGSAYGADSVACVSSKTNGYAKFKSHAHILGLQYTYKF